MDCGPPGFSFRGILQTRTLEWVPTPFSRASSWLMDRAHVSLRLPHLGDCLVLSHRQSPARVIRELKIKTMRYHHTPLRTVKIWNTSNTKCCWGCTETLIHCWLSLQKTVWQFLTKPSILLPCNTAVVLFGIYPSEWKTYLHRKTCTRIIIAHLFVVAKTWKQATCPPVSE